MTSAVIFQIQSILIFSLMTYGILVRKNQKKHVPVMYTTIIWDILLILQIELTRQAINKASNALTNEIILNIHVSFAISSVVFYFLLLWSGRKLVSGDRSVRGKHKIFGWCAYTLRALTLITSFFAVSSPA